MQNIRNTPNMGNSNSNASKSVSNSQNKVVSKHFPLKGYIQFQSANFNGLKNKTLEFNEKMRVENEALSMNDTEIQHFNAILQFLSNINQNLQLTTFQFDLIVKLLKWPLQYKTPILDLLRIFLQHYQSERLFSGVDSGINHILQMAEILKNGSQSDGLRNLVLKLMSNMF